MDQTVIKQVREKKELLRQLGFGLAVGKSKDVKLARKTRHDIARLLTGARVK